MYEKALIQFSSREGHCRVPAIHVEILEGKEISLGAWVGYTRQRYKRGNLPEDKIEKMNTLPGWEWGPLKPGPATDHNRNSQIFKLREDGESLRQIADKFDLSRQRIHQIINSGSDA